MKYMMVSYTVKADRAEENARYIAAVFEQLAAKGTARIRYAAFRLADGVSFVHIVIQEGKGAGTGLTELAAFKAFAAGVKDRCEVAPVSMEMDPIGMYRLFGNDLHE